MIYLLEDYSGYTQKEAAVLLLKYGLFREYGISGALRIGCQEMGKPYLEEYPDIHFNYSHSNAGILCGISTKEIGVDIERIIPYRDNLAKRICHPGEWDELSRREDKDAYLSRLWTLKESYLKYLGIGIRKEMNLFDFSVSMEAAFRTLDCEFYTESSDIWAIAVCAEEVEKEMLTVVLTDL